MQKIINGVAYNLPDELTNEQEAIYCHIIDWKRKNITTEAGLYKREVKGVIREYEYDALFPEEIPIPAMMYKPILEERRKMQEGRFAYKPHKFASQHAISSQTACINLFMPVLLSKKANDILAKIPGCPSHFKEIATQELYKGFCFEYWGQKGKEEIKKNTGLLNDHSQQAGTDADVAIAYKNSNNELCLWLIEHKLSENEFTVCGAYKSKANKLKENCTRCSLAEIACYPQKCYYHQIRKYKYWDYFQHHIDKYQGKIDVKGCPFRGGLNQLWRNQMLAFALQETGIYKTVTFSVCHHAKNSMLNSSIKQYKALICEDKMFSSFTNYDVLDAVCTKDPELLRWKAWYKEVYCF